MAGGAPRFKLHFTPTGASWLNLVESWFSQLAQKRICRGVFCSVRGARRRHRRLHDAHYNDDPTLFTWTATVDVILQKGWEV